MKLFDTLEDLWYRLTRITRIIREIRNYYFIKRVIRKNKRTEKWRKFNLRNNWFGTIGTVINLPPEVFSGEEIYYQVYVIEQMKPINEYLESLNLQEIVTPNIESLVDKEEGIYAFLITYKPLFRDFTWGWVISRSLVAGFLFWLNSRYGIFAEIWQFIMNVPGYITSFFDHIFG